VTHVQLKFNQKLLLLRELVTLLEKAKRKKQHKSRCLNRQQEATESSEQQLEYGIA